MTRLPLRSALLIEAKACPLVGTQETPLLVLRAGERVAAVGGVGQMEAPVLVSKQH